MNKNDTKLFSMWDFPLSLVLLTRLPIPRLPEHLFARQAKAAWAFPLVGLVVGLLGCAFGWTALAFGLPTFASAVIVVAVLVIVTGAMHEDGLADTVDGFWGGFTTERRLEIMKDSHIGAYGVLTLIFTQLLRVALIAALLSTGDFAGILAACIVSRGFMPVLMYILPSARKSGLSHSVGEPQAQTAAVSLGLAVILSIFLIGSITLTATVFALLLVAVLASVAKAKIKGQTGDVLGASQQLAELAFLMVLAASV